MKNQIFTTTGKPVGCAVPSWVSVFSDALAADNGVKVRDAHVADMGARHAGSAPWIRLRSTS